MKKTLSVTDVITIIKGLKKKDKRGIIDFFELDKTKELSDMARIVYIEQCDYMLDNKWIAKNKVTRPVPKPPNIKIKPETTKLPKRRYRKRKLKIV